MTDYESLINYRIRKILMICSNYDAFILEEDGQIEAQIYKEYIELNLSNPPKFIWVQTAAEARELLNTVVGIDMVMCMYNVTDKEVFTLASEIKQDRPTLPFVLLTHFSKEVYRRLALQDTSAIDHMFCWHGNADLIVAIVKLFEDIRNAEHDILGVGVQAILLVEDSVRYYSTYLPELYKLILAQTHEFLAETINEQQRKIRKRSRPKILLATNLDDAMAMYDKYKSNLLGVISDVGFTVHKGEGPEKEKLDAGLAEFLDNIGSNPLKAEYYLPSAVDDQQKSGVCDVKVYPTTSVWQGVTYPEDKERVKNALRGLIDAGEYPERLWD